MSGQVLWAPAGPPEALQRLQPYFDAMGRGTMHIGSEPYMASVMKLSGNFFIAATIETIAEGMTLAEKNGVSRCIVFQDVVETSQACFDNEEPQFHSRCRQLVVLYVRVKQA